jgi:hypothetical protein
MEIVSTPGRIAGGAIIDDLCAKIAAQLERSDSLRDLDIYSGYSARVHIDLQLADVYPTEVAAEVSVGNIDPQRPVERLVLDAEAVGDAEPDTSLERPIDEAGIAEAPPQQKRFYAPRNRTRLTGL